MNPEINGGTAEDNDPESVQSEKALAKWVLNQRQLYENGALAPERRDRLI